MNTEAIYNLAVFASLGVFLAGIATWFVLPLFLTENINLPYNSKNKQLFTSQINNYGVHPV